uniref:Uncharacterized protein n=1 Tax=Pseudomonas phage Touem01 TaxID=3138548 RepID=A0AAU6W3C7_9VIRU
MSKHPIPDWLRSQFSRIEDDVRKLGPCGVFTQMRTVTQTYFEQQAAAPQPPALGGDAVVIAKVWETGIDTLLRVARMPKPGPEWVLKSELIDRAHLAPLQAEIERLKALSVTNILMDVVPGDGSGHEVYAKSVKEVVETLSSQYYALENVADERDQLKARRDELEGILLEVRKKPGFFSGEFVLRLDAALSKPAGSEPRHPISEAGMKLINESIDKDGMPS